MFIVRASTVRVYSPNTGEWIRDLDEFIPADKTTVNVQTEATIVNVQNIPDDPTVLIGCTINGDIVTWNCKLGSIDSNVVSVFTMKTSIICD